MRLADLETLMDNDEGVKATPECGKHRGAMRRHLREVLGQCPATGNLSELGPDHDTIKAELLDRMQAAHRKRFGEDDGFGIGMLAIMLIGVICNFLIQWWFRDKSAHTLELSGLVSDLNRPRH